MVNEGRNGRDIQIWGRPWLRAHDNPYISPTPHMGLATFSVSFVINHDTQAWRDDILQQIFNNEDAQEIKKTP